MTNSNYQAQPPPPSPTHSSPYGSVHSPPQSPGAGPGLATPSKSPGPNPEQQRLSHEQVLHDSCTIYLDHNEQLSTINPCIYRYYILMIMQVSCAMAH